MKSRLHSKGHQVASHVPLPAHLPRISTIALAISLLFPVVTHAAEYLVGNEADLRAAITTASTNGDTNAIIKMTANVTMADTTAFPTPTVPVTIDTNGFVLTRNGLPAAAPISVNMPGQYTFDGTYVGVAGVAIAGHGLSFNGTGSQDNTVIFNGNATGGDRQAPGAGGGGSGISLGGTMTLVNNGNLQGGRTNANASAGTQQSAGVSMSATSAVINNGTIQGGEGIGGFAGAGVAFSATSTTAKLVNNSGGIIRGGSESAGGVRGNSGVLLIAGTGVIENSGQIEGGVGAVAITSSGTNTITNSGQITGGTGAGAIAVSSGTTTITNTGQITGDTGFAAISAANTASVKVINSGAITANGANAITFGATTGRATLELQAGSTITGNVVAGAGANDTLTLGGNTDSTFDIADIGVGQQYQGFDKFSKTGSSTWTLTGTSASTGLWTVAAGTLALNGTLNAPVTVAAAGTLRGNGTLIGDLTNSGRIAPGNSIGTFLVNGNYIGNGGTLDAEVQLGGTGSPADRLLITGNATGTTTINVTNVGGTGAVTGSGNTDGISIVQVAGTSSASAFQLAGGYVAAGPYQYKLSMFDPASSAASEVDPLLGAVPFYDYRLQSLVDANGQAVTVPQIGAYQGMSTGAVRYGASLLDSVHKRLGELRRASLAGNGSDGQNSEFFLRAQGSRSDVSGSRSAGYDQDIWFTQAGGNIFGKDMGDGSTLRIGGAFSYGESKLNVDHSSADVNLDGTTLALTTTYQSAIGWYLDGVAQVTRYSADIHTSERGQTGSPDGLGYALSVEGGHTLYLDENLTIEPQVQLSYQRIKFDRFTDVDNISVDLRDGESLRGRFGARIQQNLNVGTTRAWSPYVEANLLHEFLGDGSIRAAGVSFATDSLGTSLQLGGGINAQLGTNKMVFASVSYESGLSDAAADAWSGNVGMRIDF